MQAGLGVIVSVVSVSSVKAILTNTDMVLNLSLTIVPEIDPHRTGLTELAGIAGIYMEATSQRHGLSTEKLR